MNSFFARGVVVPIPFVFSRDSAAAPCDDIARCAEMFFNALWEKDHVSLQQLCGEYYDNANLLDHCRRLLLDNKQRANLRFVGAYEAWRGVQCIYVRAAQFEAQDELLAITFDLSTPSACVSRFCQI